MLSSLHPRVTQMDELMLCVQNLQSILLISEDMEKNSVQIRNVGGEWGGRGEREREGGGREGGEREREREREREFRSQLLVCNA